MNLKNQFLCFQIFLGGTEYLFVTSSETYILV